MGSGSQVFNQVIGCLEQSQAVYSDIYQLPISADSSLFSSYLQLAGEASAVSQWSSLFELLAGNVCLGLAQHSATHSADYHCPLSIPSGGLQQLQSIGNYLHPIGKSSVSIVVT